MRLSREHGPRILKELGTRLSVEDAQRLALVLTEEDNLATEAYDFYQTKHVWQSVRADGTPYKLHATKQLIRVLAERKGVDYRTFHGFKQILPELIQRTFCTVPINHWGTTLQGMLVNRYAFSPSAAVLELIAADNEFKSIRKRNLQAYDFLMAPRNMWKGKDGMPTDTSIQVTKKLIVIVAEELGVDYKTYEGFMQLPPAFTLRSLTNRPISEWGTTAITMLKSAYHSHIGAAVVDLIRVDDEFAALRGRITEDMFKGSVASRLRVASIAYSA